MKILSILVFILFANSVEARMYQWLDPDVGTTQLSGKPPVWYRSEAGGPRVFVFDNGRLIDDTAVDVSDDIRRRMRQEAFILVEKDQQKAKDKIAKAEEKNRKLKKKNASKSESHTTESVDRVDDESSAIEIITDTLFPNNEEEQEQGIAEKSLDELKAIIADWEAFQTESAKQAIE